VLGAGLLLGAQLAVGARRGAASEQPATAGAGRMGALSTAFTPTPASAQQTDMSSDPRPFFATHISLTPSDHISSWEEHAGLQIGSRGHQIDYCAPEGINHVERGEWLDRGVWGLMVPTPCGLVCPLCAPPEPGVTRNCTRDGGPSVRAAVEARAAAAAGAAMRAAPARAAGVAAAVAAAAVAGRGPVATRGRVRLGRRRPL
jgi:hypothetical protein